MSFFLVIARAVLVTMPVDMLCSLAERDQNELSRSFVVFGPVPANIALAHPLCVAEGRQRGSIL